MLDQIRAESGARQRTRPPRLNGALDIEALTRALSDCSSATRFSGPPTTSTTGDPAKWSRPRPRASKASPNSTISRLRRPSPVPAAPAQTSPPRPSIDGGPAPAHTSLHPRSGRPRPLPRRPPHRLRRARPSTFCSPTWAPSIDGGTVPRPPLLTIQYADYAPWQRETLDRPPPRRATRPTGATQLAGLPDLLRSDRPRRARRSNPSRRRVTASSPGQVPASPAQLLRHRRRHALPNAPHDLPDPARPLHRAASRHPGRHARHPPQHTPPCSPWSAASSTRYPSVPTLPANPSFAQALAQRAETMLDAALAHQEPPLRVPRARTAASPHPGL